jgi:LuxR family maltose regulon positive regulatory protein
MADLLREAATRQVVPAYVGELLAAFQSQDPMSPVPSRAPKRPALQSVSEQLSQRELDVLRLFNSELSGPEIARELVVALSTVRTHTKSIYGKLGVTSRHAAVKRAGEMGLI